jgi:hypothetical protein
MGIFRGCFNDFGMNCETVPRDGNSHVSRKYNSMKTSIDILQLIYTGSSAMLLIRPTGHRPIEQYQVSYIK